jgi:hypothetical protein
LRDSLCCSGGCGEFYAHPWINDPPDQCDPCDDHGGWIGPHPCGPPACGPGGCPATWHNLWGYRNQAVCYDGGAPGYASEPYDGQVIEGPVIDGPTPAEPIPTPPAEDAGGSAPPEPPPATLPGPQAGVRKMRSALKKVDGRPAVYYNGH